MPKTTIVYKPDHKYIIKAPNEGYNGVTAGVQFSDGLAVIEADTYKNKADKDRDPAQALDLIQQHSPDYEIEERAPRLYVAPDLDHLRDEDGNLRTKKKKSED